jgi:hypothetical protein
MRAWRGVLHTLVSFLNNLENGRGFHFNFILSNGTRSTQSDEKYLTDHTHMIPSDAIKRIRSVKIYYLYNRCICGFSFFDKDGELIWEIGNTGSRCFKETVLLADSEVIVGVVAKLYPDYQSVFTDF